SIASSLTTSCSSRSSPAPSSAAAGGAEDLSVPLTAALAFERLGGEAVRPGDGPIISGGAGVREPELSRLTDWWTGFPVFPVNSGRTPASTAATGAAAAMTGLAEALAPFLRDCGATSTDIESSPRTEHCQGGATWVATPGEGA